MPPPRRPRHAAPVAVPPPSMPAAAAMARRPVRRRPSVRELEFLPDWYPGLRRQRRLVILQAWMTLAVLGGLGLWLLLAQRNVHNAAAAVAALDAQVLQTRTEQRQL